MSHKNDKFASLFVLGLVKTAESACQNKQQTCIKFLGQFQSQNNYSNKYFPDETTENWFWQLCKLIYE